jgi:hypothetical protein
MAETQPEVERIKLDRVLIAEIAEQEHEIHLIQQKIRKLYRDRAAKLQEFDHQNVMDGGENPTENVRCKNHKVHLQRMQVVTQQLDLPECEVRGTENEHVCNPDNIKKPKLATRSCPNQCTREGKLRLHQMVHAVRLEHQLLAGTNTLLEWRGTTTNRETPRRHLEENSPPDS